MVLWQERTDFYMLFDLCYSENYGWDSLSKWFIATILFYHIIVTMQKSNGKELHLKKLDCSV